MSVKIRQRFRIINGIRVEDGQHSTREREREREEVDNDEAAATEVAGGGRRQQSAAARVWGVREGGGDTCILHHYNCII
jgi:hypothetical protein